MELTAQDGKHVHARVRLPFQQDRNIFAVHFDTDGWLKGSRMAHMVQTVEHGGKAKKLALRWFVDYYLLVVLVDGSHADLSRNENVPAPSFIPDLVDSLAGGELLHLHLTGQNRSLVVV
jgi:hypothetical protein